MIRPLVVDLDGTLLRTGIRSKVLSEAALHGSIGPLSSPIYLNPPKL